MNNVDKQYLDLMQDIIDNGVKKQTRAGEVLSVFDRTMRFDLSEGLPLLTTKKVFTKGIIYETIWFLNGGTNIKYLVDHGVNIWTPDAYRYYCELIDRHNSIVEKQLPCVGFEEYKHDKKTVVSYDDFIQGVKHSQKLWILIDETNLSSCYTFGDVGDIYGKQWTSFGVSNFNQIQDIIDKLKNNPDDRRMLCCAYNPDAIYSYKGVALPPCHLLFNVYTREATDEERAKWVLQHPEKTSVPKRVLNLSFYMRSNDFCCGNPYNICQYSIINYILSEICDYIPGEVVYHGIDVHIYTNHLDGAKEQLTRKGTDYLPKLKFARQIDSVNELKYEDFIIEDYNPEPAIKYQLNVG